MPENARRRHPLDTGGPWGTGLLTLGVLIGTYGLGLVFARAEDLRGALAWINHGVPVAVWGGVWMATGAWSVWHALTPPQRHIDVAPAVGVLCLWAGLYAAFFLYSGAMLGDWTRDWTGAVIFGAFALVIVSYSRCVNPPRPPDR